MILKLSELALVIFLFLREAIFLDLSIDVPIFISHTEIVISVLSFRHLRLSFLGGAPSSSLLLRFLFDCKGSYLLHSSLSCLRTSLGNFFSLPGSFLHFLENETTSLIQISQVLVFVLCLKLINSFFVDLLLCFSLLSHQLGSLVHLLDPLLFDFLRLKELVSNIEQVVFVFWLFRFLNLES